MKYEILDTDAGPVLTLRDQLTFSCRERFETIIDKLMVRHSPVITLDLSGLEYMDSAGLGMLLTLRDRAEQNNQEIRLRNPSPEVGELLTLACFDTLFTIERV